MIIAYVLAKVEAGKDEEVLKEVRKMEEFSTQFLPMAYMTYTLRFL